MGDAGGVYDAEGFGGERVVVVHAEHCFLEFLFDGLCEGFDVGRKCAVDVFCVVELCDDLVDFVYSG